MANVREPDAGARTLSGECRIDGIPVNGQAVLIDGLRLQLDLRLAPSSRGAQPRLRVLARQAQKLAAVAAMGALVSALVVWFSGPPPAHLPPLPAFEPSARAPVAAAPSAPASNQPPSAPAAPRVSVAPAPPSPFLEPQGTEPANSRGRAALTPAQGTGGTASMGRPAPRSGRAAPSASASPTAAARPETRSPATAAPTSPGSQPRSAPHRDSLDLFGDTK